jgi:hypothetical protein
VSLSRPKANTAARGNEKSSVLGRRKGDEKRDEIGVQPGGLLSAQKIRNISIASVSPTLQD